MRGLLPTTAVLVFQFLCLGLLRGIFLGEGVRAVLAESAEAASRPPATWNNIVSKAARRKLVGRQTSTGNRTKDLYDFFAPDAPPASVGLFVSFRTNNRLILVAV